MANLIKDITVGSNVTQVDLTGLDIQKGELYEMVITVVSNGATGDVQLLANSSVSGNYYFQYIFANGATIGSGRINSSANVNSGGGRSIAKVYVKLTNDGHFVSMSSEVRNAGSSVVILSNVVNTSTVTFSSITSLTIKSPNANTIGIGSRIQLYKVAEKVDEVIVAGSSVTQVDFTGLDIGKGNEYMLVSDVVNNTAGTVNTFLGFNDNLTKTDYWLQYLLARTTTVGGGRVNANGLTDVEVGHNALVITKIKVANSGYINYQTQEAREYGESTLWLVKLAVASTFTTSLITKTSVKSDQASGIGIGSRFSLYKLI